MAPKRTTGDPETVVRALLERWKTADAIDRSVSLGGMGQPPEAGAVPYSWVTWQGRKLMSGEDHAKYNAIRRAVARLEKAGEVRTYVFTHNGRYAWIVTEKCNNGQPNGADNAPGCVQKRGEPTTDKVDQVRSYFEFH